MNVLFLLSSLEPAGSETYALALEHAWRGRHRVFWISDRLHYDQTYTSLPISQKAVPGGIKNTWAVARYMRDHQIDLVHSHSRRAHWVAAQAAWLARIPHVTTIHQPMPVHLFSRLFPCLGDHTIAIDETIVEHLARYFRRSGPRVSLIRNGIVIPPMPLDSVQPPEGKPKRILLLGRLSGGRWKTFLFFIDVLKRIGATLPATRFEIAGRVEEKYVQAFETVLKETNAMIAPSSLTAVGWTPNLPGLLSQVDGVVAGGRSALEGLVAGKPVILLGEGGVIGRCTRDTWNESLRTNQADHMRPKQWIPAKLEVALREMLGTMPSSDDRAWSRHAVETAYALPTIADAIDKVYQCLPFRS